MSAQFQLIPSASGNGINMHGTDDLGNPFHVTLDRVWAMNLAGELDDWLSGGKQLSQRELHRVDL